MSRQVTNANLNESKACTRASTEFDRISTYIVNTVDVFNATVILPFHPVSVQIITKPVQDFTWKLIVFPLLCEKSQNFLVGQVRAGLWIEMV